jgi:hypothetical protein
MKLKIEHLKKQWVSDPLFTENNGKPQFLVCLKIVGPRRVQSEAP